MALAFVQGKFTASIASTASVAATFTSTVTAGNLILVGIGWNNGDATISIADTVSNTYTQIGSTLTAVNSYNAAIFYAKNIAGGANTVTATLAAGSTNANIVVHEVSGADTTSPVDTSAAQILDPGTGTDGATSGPFTTTANGEYIWGFATKSFINASDQTLTSGTNFTQRQQNTDLATVVLTTEDLIQTSAGSISATLTSAGFDRALVFGVGLKAPSAGADTAFVGPVFRSRMREW